MGEQITDTATIIRRLRDGVPCADSEGYPCKSREARSGCDCAIAADKIESDAKVIAALREALGTVKLYIADQVIAHATVVPADAAPNEKGRFNPTFPSLMQIVTQALAAANEQNVPVCEIEPHAYVPSAMHMGDCQMCGHLQGAPHHSPFSQR